MKANDVIRLQHMLDYARTTMQFTFNKTRTNLNNDMQLALAIMKGIEIIGEAAANISQKTKDQLTQFDWADIVGMRNRLVHVYFNIDFDIIWDTVKNDIPILIEDLEKIPELK